MKKTTLSLVVGLWAVLLVATAAAQDVDLTVTDKDLETEESMWNLYKWWCSVYYASSSSRDLADVESRFEAFKANARHVNEFNKKEGMTYRLGLNQFSDMTFEEFAGKFTGGRTGSIAGDLRDGAVTYCKPPAVGYVPPSWNWTKYGVVTPVKNQLTCGSCWAFSVAAAVESINMIRTGNLLTLSEQQILDCSGAGDCNGGYPYDAFDYVIKTGISLDNRGNPPYYPPYENQKQKCRFDPRKPPFVKIDGECLVPSGNETALKLAVLSQPVSVVITISDEFRSYRGGVFRGPCGSNPNVDNHVVLVVGYGVTTDNIKYWIIKNSWGKTWGEYGYIRMERDILNKNGICGITTWAICPLKNKPRLASADAAAAVAAY
ncbi:thiol protease SEN102 [Oryza sativa Japonica Group]|uniref:Os09g0564500 protein n=1 Tax=Oryza sativa subsp. japonica TaxID=39947 RepID=A0A0N7KRA0_ORYSJ|nr:ervatamin-B [Oryza sativa Japonica Group]KAF2917554.1 hypothetical protein DAI22_09g201300 [Oryza sativa Japonica Group]BAT09434.1 Os09g0564500 [Oryza sativa Japonica Group]